MISDYNRSNVQLERKRRSGSFISGRAWETYTHVTVEDRENVTVPVVETGMALAFKDMDAGHHVGQCKAVSESWYVGYVKEVWDKDADGDGEIHVSFRNGPRIPVEDVQPIPQHLSNILDGREDGVWVETHMGYDTMASLMDEETADKLHLCERCKEEGEHVREGQSIVR